MLWQFRVDGKQHRAVYANGRLFTDFPAVGAMAEYFVESETEVECGEVGPRLVASLDASDRAWGTIDTAVRMFADFGSVVAPPSLFPEEVLGRAGAAELVKARFASRSEAARYAAEQRWKGHVKDGGQGASDLQKEMAALAERAQKILDFADKTWSTTITPDQYETTTGVGWVTVVVGDAKRQVPSVEVMRLEADMRVLGRKILDEIESSATEITAEDQRRIIQERQTKIAAIDQQIAQVKGVIGDIGEILVANLAPSEPAEMFSPKRATIDYATVMPTIFESGLGITTEAQARMAAMQGLLTAIQRREVEFGNVEREFEAARERGDKERAKELYGIKEKQLAILNDLRRVRWDLDRGKKEPIPRLLELQNEKDGIAHQEVPAVGKTYVKALAETFKKMGIAIGGEPKVETAVVDKGSLAALQDGLSRVIPTRIIEEVNNHRLPLGIEQGAGEYRPKEHLIRGYSNESVMMHEYLHAVTNTTAFGRLMENAVFDRRTMGEQSAEIDSPFIDKIVAGRQGKSQSYSYPDGTGIGGMTAAQLAFDAPPDAYILDKFADPYSGRVYAFTDLKEVFTTGIEQLYGGGFAQKRGASQDRELMAATVGFLAVFGALGSNVGKGRFASRSEAARYAAEQRWKGHVKEEDKGDELKTRVSALAKEAAAINGLPLFPKDLLLLTPEGHAGSEDSIFVKVQLDDGTVVEVPSERVMRFERECRAVGEELLKRVEGAAETTTQEDVDRFREERTDKLIEADAKIASLQEKFADLGEKLVAAGIKNTDSTATRRPEIEKLYTDAGFGDASEATAGSIIAAQMVQKRYMDQIVALRGSGTASVEEITALENKVEAARQILLFTTDISDMSLANTSQMVTEYRSLTDERKRITRSKPPAAGTKYMDALRGEMEKLGIAFGAQPDLIGAGLTGARGKMLAEVTATVQYDVSQVIPSPIIEAVNRVGLIRIDDDTQGGGSFDPNERLITTSGTRSTNVHEYVHAVTYSVPAAMGVEQAVLARRTFGRTQDALKDKSLADKLKTGQQKFVTKIKYPNGQEMGMGGYTGQIYARSGFLPTFKLDKFTDPYAGRIYARNGATDGAETLTVGIEHLIGEGGGMRAGAAQDRDLMAATLGMLVALGRMP